MIGYITLGTNDLPKAVDFYDAVLAEMGSKKVVDFGRFVGWSIGDAGQMLAVVTPYNEEPATFGNGTMIALNVGDKALVDKLHAKALSQGATNEGDPGLRMEVYYCAYIRDLDGNKINFYCQP